MAFGDLADSPIGKLLQAARGTSIEPWNPGFLSVPGSPEMGIKPWESSPLARQSTSRSAFGQLGASTSPRALGPGSLFDLDEAELERARGIAMRALNSSHRGLPPELARDAFGLGPRLSGVGTPPFTQPGGIMPPGLAPQTEEIASQSGNPMLARLRALLGKIPPGLADKLRLAATTAGRGFAGVGLGMEGYESPLGRGMAIPGVIAGAARPDIASTALLGKDALQWLTSPHQPTTGKDLGVVDKYASPMGAQYLKEAQSQPGFEGLPAPVAMAALALKKANEIKSKLPASEGGSAYKRYIENIINPMLRATFPNLQTSAALASVYARAYDHLTGGSEKSKGAMHSWATPEVNQPENAIYQSRLSGPPPSSFASSEGF